MGDIEELKGKYEGEEVFFIGNGPSLSNVELNKLNNHLAIGVNNINAIYNQTDWRPDFYVCVKSSVHQAAKKWIVRNIELGIPCFVNKVYKDEIRCSSDQIYYIDKEKLKLDPVTRLTSANNPTMASINEISKEDLQKYWSSDISDVIYSYHSPYAIYQILFYLGFKDIYLLGHDLGYEVMRKHMIFADSINPANYTHSKVEFIQDAIEQDVFLGSFINGLAYKFLQSPFGNIFYKFSRDDQLSHFSSGHKIKPDKVRFTNNNAEIRNTHQIAKRIADRQNISIYNASSQGELDVFDRIDLSEIVG